MFYVLLRLARDVAPRGRFAGRAPSRTSPRCSIWWRWAPSPTSSGSTASIASWSSRACDASAPAACSPGSPRCSRSAGRDPRRATTYDLGFVAGPRLNAAGRLSDMSIGIALPARRRRGDARSALARELDRLNRERRDIEATMQDEALAALDAPVDVETRARLCLYRRGMAPRRGRRRCVAAQGPLSPSGDRVRAAGRRRASRFRALDRRLSSARRARSGGQARAGNDHPLRRARVRRRPVASAKRSSARFAEAFERVGTRVADRRRNCERRIETDGALAAAS